MLRTRGLTVRRGSRIVLDGVDLDVHAGRVTAVVGLNGSGKSTLLLALAGLLPASGTVSGGAVGLVFQHPEHQFLARTVRDEIAWGPRRARATDVDDRVSGAVGRLPPDRAGGTATRSGCPAVSSAGLSLAAMAVCGHDVLLADEPTFGQDRRTSAACADALRRLADEGRGIVLVTHDLRLVGEVADDVLVLGGGQVLAHGPVDAILRRRRAARPRRAAPAPGARGLADHRPPPARRAARPARCRPTGRRRCRHENPASGQALPHDSLLHRRKPHGQARRVLRRVGPPAGAGRPVDAPRPARRRSARRPGGGPDPVADGSVPRRSSSAPSRARCSPSSAVTRDGPVVAEALGLEVTGTGVAIGAALALRTALVGILAVAFSLTTDGARLMTSLHQHGPARRAPHVRRARRLPRAGGPPGAVDDDPPGAVRARSPAPRGHPAPRPRIAHPGGVHPAGRRAPAGRADGDRDGDPWPGLRSADRAPARRAGPPRRPVRRGRARRVRSSSCWRHGAPGSCGRGRRST